MPKIETTIPTPQQARRIARYGKLVNAARWKTTPERIAAMSAFCKARGIDKTELIELSVDEYMKNNEVTK